MARAEHQSLSQQAVLLHRSGKLAEAEALYLGALAADAKDVRALHLLGVLRAQQGRLAEALESHDRAISLDPDSSNAHNNRGAALALLGRLEEGIQSFDKAIALKPESVQAHTNRGKHLADLDRLDEALASYERAAVLKPNSAEAHFGKPPLIVIELTKVAPTGPTLVTVDIDAEVQADKDARAAVAAHPLVQEAISLFGGELREVKLPDNRD